MICCNRWVISEYSEDEDTNLLSVKLFPSIILLATHRNLKEIIIVQLILLMMKQGNRNWYFFSSNSKKVNDRVLFNLQSHRYIFWDTSRYFGRNWVIKTVVKCFKLNNSFAKTHTKTLEYIDVTRFLEDTRQAHNTKIKTTTFSTMKAITSLICCVYNVINTNRVNNLKNLKITYNINVMIAHHAGTEF